MCLFHLHGKQCDVVWRKCDVRSNPSEKAHVVYHMGMPTSNPHGLGPQKPHGLGVGMPISNFVKLSEELLNTKGTHNLIIYSYINIYHVLKFSKIIKNSKKYFLI